MDESPLTREGQRYSKVPGERALIAALVLLIVATPIVFFRTTMFPFFLPQLTVLWAGFTDDDGSVFEEEIETLYANGVTTGCTTTTFCPTGLVTREQMAAFVIRALAVS